MEIKKADSKGRVTLGPNARVHYVMTESRDGTVTLTPLDLKVFLELKESVEVLDED